MIASPSASRGLLDGLAPGLFVLLWSTGFIGAKLGMPYAGPLTFLLLRFAIVAALLAAVALLVRAPWQKDPVQIGHIMAVGLLVHGGYLGGVFLSLDAGLSVGLAALVTGLQPLLTAAAAGMMLGDRVKPRQWLGLALGLFGVALVVWNKVDLGGDLFGLWFAFGAVLSISAGTLYQKRFCAQMDLRSGAAVQYIAAAAVMAVLAPLSEPLEIVWSGEFIFALAWLCLVLSVGAVNLLYRLIRAGSAARVGSYFYLVPPTTALIAFFVFGETLALQSLVGMALTVAAVALATRS